MPFWQALCHLQNSCLSLLILTGVVVIWRSAESKRSAVVAGLLASLLAYKPQLAVLVIVSLSATLGWPALLGSAIGLGILALATLVLMPGTIGEYLHALPPFLRMIQERPQYNWGRQVTPQGFWQLLLQGHTGGAARPITTLIVTVTVLAALATFGWILWRYRTDRTRRDQLIALTICASPVLMPYFMDYDLLLLAIPAVLIAKHWIDVGAPAAIGRFAPLIWSILFISLYVNPGLTGSIRLNFAALLTIATASITANPSVWISARRSESIQTAYTPFASAA
jgi:hypothetical protein